MKKIFYLIAFQLTTFSLITYSKTSNLDSISWSNAKERKVLTSFSSVNQPVFVYRSVRDSLPPYRFNADSVIINKEDTNVKAFGRVQFTVYKNRPIPLVIKSGYIEIDKIKKTLIARGSNYNSKTQSYTGEATCSDSTIKAIDGIITYDLSDLNE